jgi:hypothetical protein
MSDPRRLRPLSITVAAIAAVLLVGCNLSNSAVKADRAQKELERVPVPRHYELVTEGENDSGEQTFQYRLYATTRIGKLAPPTDRYVEMDLLAGFRRGWRVLRAWNGLNEDELGECIIVYERPEDDSALEDLPRSVLTELEGRTTVRLEAWCGDAQHSFD